MNTGFLWIGIFVKSEYSGYPQLIFRQICCKKFLIILKDKNPKHCRVEKIENFMFSRKRSSEKTQNVFKSLSFLNLITNLSFLSRNVCVWLEYCSFLSTQFSPSLLTFATHRWDIFLTSFFFSVPFHQLVVPPGHCCHVFLKFKHHLSFAYH